MVVLASALFAPSARADVVPASLFTDHMVLQQGMSVPVWGMASPGEKVTVTLGAQSQSATAGADGKWMVRLAELKAGGPLELKIAGTNALTIKDVLVGEVWLCSGQSNMDFTVARTQKYYFAGALNEAEEVAAANYPTVRMFKGDPQKKFEPQISAPGEWKVCNPENVREMSAIGYFFARDLQKQLNVPVGIVCQSFGASCAEAWISREALTAEPKIKPLLDSFDEKVRTYAVELRRQPRTSAPAVVEVPAAAAAGAATTGPASRPRRQPNRDPVQDQHNATVMYNGMIAPVIPFAMRGVLWYQGESIVGGAEGVKLYPLVQNALIQDWRQRWGQGEFPFYIVQLAAHKAPATQPVQNSSIANVREAQQTVLALPNTGMAVTIDVGDAKDVHPKNKQAVGDRLMRIAMAKTYGRAMEYSGPMYESMQVNGNAIRVKFTHTEGGLVAKDGALKQFMVAGKDGKFIWADAKIDGDSVVVSSPEVSEPAAVRYAWADNPVGCNLYNGAGLPAAPFGTDK